MSVYNFAETIVAGSSAQGGGVVEQSLKFNSAETSYLTRTPAAASNQKTWTWSAWIKRSNIGLSNRSTLFSGRTTGTSNLFGFLNPVNGQGADTFGAYLGANADNRFQTTRVFRDPNAWYHFVVVLDTTDSTSGDRFKLYVNGTRETVWTRFDSITQNQDKGFNEAIVHALGVESSVGMYFDGYMAEVNFVDGQALSPTSFGKTVNGNWKSKDYTGTYGTNGFRLNFQDDVVSEGFNAVTYRATAAAGNAISGLGFSPALVWTKARENAYDHEIYDVCRGATSRLKPNEMIAATTVTTNLTSFDGDGFTLSTTDNSNYSAGNNSVAWCWEGGGTPTATNSAGAGAVPTAGSVKIDGVNSTSALAGSTAATKISANTTRGFSVVTFTADAASGTVAHGLTTAPDLIIAKPVNHAGTNWYVQVPDVLPANEILNLDSNAAAFNPGENHFNDTVPTDSVFSYAGYMNNQFTGDDKLAYCFHSVNGYSKIGSFTGNGGSNPIDVGFAPAFVLLKRTNSSSWGLFDNTRHPANRQMQSLSPNLPAIETTNAQMTFVGNTFNDNGYFSDSGTTVIYMAFADTREAAFFKDVSGQGNHFAPQNLDYRDSMIDSPTNNFSTMNGLQVQGGSATTPYVLSEGRLKMTSTANNYAQMSGSMGVQSGKWYTETYINSAGYPSWYIGWTSSDRLGTWTGGNNADGVTTGLGYFTGSNVYIQDFGDANNSSTNVAVSGLWSGGRAPTTGDIIGCAVDFDNRKIWWSINGEYVNIGSGAGDPANGTNPASTYTSSNAADDAYKFAWQLGYGSTTKTINFGQDSTFSGATPAGSNTDANGIGTFKYAPPAGFLSLCSANLPEPSITDASEHFNTVLYTGNGSTQSITGVNHQPDFVWIKDRTDTYGHILHDVIRGTQNYLSTSTTGTEQPQANGLVSFDTDGFSVGSWAAVNNNTDSLVGWNWKAGGTPTATNTAGAGNAPTSGSVMIDGVASTTALNGDIPATKISANTKSGFSIVSYTGTGATNPTVNHGLTKTPEFIILKDRDSNQNNNNWNIWHKDAGDGDDYGYFTNAAFPSNGSAQVIGTDNNVFTLKPNLVTSNESGDNYIAYLFHSVEGYSKVGSYIGNGSADGTFAHTGFRPAWIMIKKSSAAGTSWQMYDNKRDIDNVVENRLIAEGANAEGVGSDKVDFLSNGFKLRENATTTNHAATYIYLAFAESPFKNSNAR